MLPQETPNLKKATPAQLIYQGLYLHFASLWGPLRTSPAYRKQNKNWFTQSISRWLQEYGSNLAVFLLGQATILLYLPQHYLLATLALIITLPGLTVLQMFVDNYRTDSQVYYNPTTKTGLTVKIHTENNTTTWTYYNHFALPIGAKNGKTVREELHEQAKHNKHVLTCHAQNLTIASYYLSEKPEGISDLHSKRPHLVWNYSGTPWEQRKTSFLSQLFGIHSTRNTGQIPLGKNKPHLTVTVA